MTHELTCKVTLDKEEKDTLINAASIISEICDTTAKYGIISVSGDCSTCPYKDICNEENVLDKLADNFNIEVV